jgi:hypothetical protein
LPDPAVPFKRAVQAGWSSEAGQAGPFKAGLFGPGGSGRLRPKFIRDHVTSAGDVVKDSRNVIRD